MAGAFALYLSVPRAPVATRRKACAYDHGHHLAVE
jgi:hypothetical protein